MVNYENIRTLNYIRWLMFFPTLYYITFRIIGTNEKLRYKSYNYIFILVSIVMVLSLLKIYFPGFEIWKYYYINTGLSENEVIRVIYESVENRNTGIFTNAIFMANYSVIAISIGFSKFLMNKRSFPAFKGFLLMLLGYAVLYSTYSRGPLLIITSIIILMIFLKCNNRSKTTNLVIKIGTILAFPIFLYGFFIVIEQRNSLSNQIIDFTRTIIWSESLSVSFGSLRNFLFGVSQSDFYRLSGWFHAHSFYLSTILFLGVPFGLAYSLILVIKNFDLAKRHKFYKKLNLNKTLDYEICTAINIIFTAFLIENLIETSYFYEPRIASLVFVLLAINYRILTISPSNIGKEKVI
jgi:hypothetical protein